METIDLVGK